MQRHRVIGSDGPEPDYRLSLSSKSSSYSLHYRRGQEDTLGFQAQCLGCFEVVVNLVWMGLFDWRVSRLVPPNYSINIHGALPCYCKKVGSQAYQTSCNHRFPKTMAVR